MKILVLSHVSDYTGGAERSILDVLDLWKKEYNDIKIEFILRKPLGSYVAELQKRKYKYYAVDYTYWNDNNLPGAKDKERLFTMSQRNSKAIKSIEQIIKTSKPDFVITNSIVAPWAAFAAYYTGVPHVWFAREYGNKDHGREFEIGEKESFEDIGNLSMLVVSNSKTLANHMSQYIDNSKIATLYNPFDLKKLDKLACEKVKNPYASKNSLKLILTAGGISASKGHLDTIVAVGRLNKDGYDVELAIAGNDGPKDFMQEIHKTIDDFGIKSKVHFLGYQTNPMAFAKLADVGIMSSNKEAFGRVTFEYLAIGTPVVGSNSGATPEIVDNSINGLLYEVGDVDDLIAKIKIYAKDSDLIAKHSKEAVKKAKLMMSGENNPYILYDRIIDTLSRGMTKPTIINYTHRWLDYPGIARDYMDSVSELSIKTIAYKKMRQKAKRYYLAVRGMYAKTLGK